MKVHQLASAMAGALVLTGAASVGAQTLSSQTSSLRTGTQNYSTNSGANYSNYDTGALRLSDGSSTFWAYCIDPLTGSSFPNAYSSMSLASFLNGTNTSGYAQQIGRSGYGGVLSNSSTAQSKVLSNLQELFSYAYNDSLTSAVKSSAFGMAVWEIIMQDWTAVAAGDGFVRTSGRVRSNGSTSSTNDGDAREVQTTTYLNALSNNTWASIGLSTVTNWVYTVYFDNASPVAQSFIKVSEAAPPPPPPPPPPGVPEPASLALVGAALAGMAAASRRARRRG